MSKGLTRNCKAKKLTFAKNGHPEQFCQQCWHLDPASDIVMLSFLKEFCPRRIAAL